MSLERSTYIFVIIVLPKECTRVWLLAAQKTINRPGWWKGKFALFQVLAM